MVSRGFMVEYMDPLGRFSNLIRSFGVSGLSKAAGIKGSGFRV